MAQLEEAAAVAEAEVIPTAPDNSADETTQTIDAQDFYADDQPETDDPQDVDDLDDAEEPEEAIEAPASLKAEEKEQFSQLPPEAQRALSDILGRRDRETQQGLEAARSAQRDAERSAADTVAAAQQGFAQRVQGFIEAFKPQQPDIGLLESNPTAYLLQERQYQADVQSYNQLVEQTLGMRDQADGHFAQQEQQATAERIRGLMSIPEFADAEKRPAFVNALETFGTSDLGYSVDRLGQMDVTDMTALKRAMAWKAKADKWDAHTKRRNERPRTVGGRFQTAPAGNGAVAATSQNDVLKLLYSNE